MVESLRMSGSKLAAAVSFVIRLTAASSRSYPQMAQMTQMECLPTTLTHRYADAACGRKTDLNRTADNADGMPPLLPLPPFLSYLHSSSLCLRYFYVICK
jgi:hypothetical protein